MLHRVAQVFNIHEAKTHLSHLIAKAVEGEPFIIAKAGVWQVQVTSVKAPNSKQVKRLGFMKDQIKVPDDFDLMGRDEIQHLFGVGA